MHSRAAENKFIDPHLLPVNFYKNCYKLVTTQPGDYCTEGNSTDSCLEPVNFKYEIHTLAMNTYMCSLVIDTIIDTSIYRHRYSDMLQFRNGTRKTLRTSFLRFL